jgi:hypothetical protein
MIEKRKEDYKFNQKLVYGVLWKHCSLPLQNSIRGTEKISATVQDKNVVSLRAEVKRLCDVYDRYPQECNSWLEAGNTFVESEIVIEGDVEMCAVRNSE